jgi:hypothetical protein
LSFARTHESQPLVIPFSEFYRNILSPIQNKDIQLYLSSF